MGSGISEGRTSGILVTGAVSVGSNSSSDGMVAELTLINIKETTKQFNLNKLLSNEKNYSLSFRVTPKTFVTSPIPVAKSGRAALQCILTLLAANILTRTAWNTMPSIVVTQIPN